MKNNKNLVIAKRYAKSLIKPNIEHGLADNSIENSLNNVKTILDNSKDLYDILNNPIISAQDKEEIIDAVFEKDTDETSRKFLKLLISKNRFDAIYDIIEVYNDELNKIKNIENVNVTCAIELNDDKKQLIEKELKEKLNKEIKIDYALDDKIIAGLVYKIGDNTIDTSLAYKLEEFKKEIIK